MCGRVIQSSTPFRLAIVDGLDVRDSRFHDYPPRWNGAPIRRKAKWAANDRYIKLQLRPHCTPPEAA
jgi:hypothetical protein